MQYEFLKNFPKRMKNVGLYGVLIQNSIQKTSWKQFGFSKFDEQMNLIFAVMLYIMEQSLREENCTMDDIEAQREYPITWKEVSRNSGGEGFLSLASWPTYEEAKTVDAQTEIGVQINGKLRGTVVIPTGADKEEVFAMAKADSRIASLVEGKTFVKEIYVPNRVVNFVVK